MPDRPLHSSGDSLHRYFVVRALEYHIAMDTSPARSQATPGYGLRRSGLGFGLIDATQTVFVMRAEGMHHAWVRLFVTDGRSVPALGAGDGDRDASWASISSGSVEGRL